MVIGIGTDIVNINRLKEKLFNNEELRRKIFNRNEIEYCEIQQNPFQHYAGFFAAKESVLKALGVGLVHSFDLHQIEIRHGEHGKPEVLLGLSFEVLLDQGVHHVIHLSISHDVDYAIAYVMVDTQ
jgi:holo-[acyl-carrier protein] synthase